MVPEGWKLTSLKEACNNQLQTGPFGSQLHSHEYVDEGIPVLMPKDLNDFRANIETAAKITEERGRDLKKHWLQKGDILFSRRGDVARFALIDEQASNAICGTGCLRVRASDQYYPKYLSYFLQLHQVRKWLEQNSVGQTMPNMNTEILGELPLKLATNLKEQKKIAQTLSTWDKAITTTEQLLANSQQQKKALMQQLLTGKKRLLDDNGVRFSGEWKKLKLKKLFDFKRGKGLSKSAIKKDGQKKCILYGELFTCYPEVISNVLSRTNEGDSILSVKGDILIPSSTTTSGVDLANATALLESGVLLGGDINILRPKEKLSSRFFAYLLTHIEKYQIASFAQGITIIHIYGADLKKVEVKVPLSISEQQKIAAVLSSADQKIDSLQQKIEALKQEKKALMQQLLTGKRRVKP